MLDLQNEKDERNLPLDKVGVKGVKYPVVLRDKEKGVQQTIAEVNMYVDLPLHFRGTHMSRFIEILHEHAQNIDLRNLKALLLDMKTRLSASKAHLDLSFPYVIEKKTPVTGIPCFMVIQCTYRAALDGNEKFTLIYGITMPIQTVCPCSKAISDFGAHNQRAAVTIQVASKKLIWIEDLVKIAETASSSPVYPLLKREDEKFVTEQGYTNAKFVEDVVRDICLLLQKQESILWFSIETRSMESIHDHDAFAYIEWGNFPW